MNSIICDTHAHTNLTDGNGAPEEMIAAAAEKGLKVFALTDHFDMNSEPGHIMRGAGTEAAYERMTSVKRGNAAPLKFLIGIELGQAHRYPDEARSWIASHEYDYVLGSCHAVRGREDFYHLRNRDDFDADKLFRQYLEEVFELCEFGGFDALAHLTYPLRYMRGKADVSGYKAEIDGIFRVLIKKDIALEINGQMINQQYNRLSPETAEISRYRELGGRLVTIGSDAHFTHLIGNGIAECIAAAKAAGFGEYAYYEGRKAKFIAIK